ncbi:hypothetical protein [Erwinia persicina]|uniref:hypothetical protein n=1 Tax=Erwinia persicina TaxID=55211 RepID=UPI0017868EAF|nr:hypothetical protein [Erwinia persicina]MBD8163294.1 hypothetical protein [Erwinia persicina]
MNFADSKRDNLTKKIVVRAFEANHGNANDLALQIFNNGNFINDKIVIVTNEKHIKIRDISKSQTEAYVYFSIYNPKESVSISPNAVGVDDLVDVENYDNVHVFLKVKNDKMIAIFQISTNWPENKLMLIFEKFGIKITPSTVLDTKIVDALRSEGFKSLHVNINVHASDFNKKPSFIDSLIKNEPRVGNQLISGHLEITGKGNSTIASSIEQQPQKWIDDLDPDFYIETKKGRKITGDDIKLNRVYFTVPYGSKTIHSKYAIEIIDHFILNAL